MDFSFDLADGLALLIGGGLLGGAWVRNHAIVAYSEAALKWAHGVRAALELTRDQRFRNAPTLPGDPPEKPRIIAPPWAWANAIEDRLDDVESACAAWCEVFGNGLSPQEWESQFPDVYRATCVSIDRLRDAVFDVGKSSFVWLGPRFKTMLRVESRARAKPLEPKPVAVAIDERRRGFY